MGHQQTIKQVQVTYNRDGKTKVIPVTLSKMNFLMQNSKESN
jgi:hypothetical protein